jgi:hypothetical protein
LIKQHIYEVIFIGSGLFLFGGFCFDTANLEKSKSNYFFNAPNHHLNSIRQFSVGKISKSTRNERLPKVEITIDEQDFFGFNNGIYTLGEQWFNNEQRLNSQWWQHNANYKQRGKLWERDGTLSLTFQDSSLSSNTHIRINGNNTRAYPQKSFRAKLDKQFEYQLFGEQRSGWIIFRNSGNDWDRTLFADAFISKSISELNVITSKSNPVSMYLNDYYWGIYNARQRIDEDFLAKKFSCKKKDVFLYEFSGNVENGDDEALKEIESLKKAIQKGKVDKVKDKIDIDNFIDYIIVESFFNNTDWPSNNVLFFKIDGQSNFTFILKDLDFGLAYTSPKAFQHNMFSVLKSKNTLVSDLFNLLINDKSFNNEFKKRANYLMNNELSENNLIRLYDEFHKQYALEMPKQIERWRKPYTIEKWNQNVNENRDFLLKRNRFYLNQVDKL